VPCFLIKACIYQSKDVLLSLLLRSKIKVDFDDEKFPSEFFTLFEPVINEDDLRLCRIDFVDLNKALQSIDSLTLMEYAFSHANNKCLSLIIDLD